MTLLNTNYVMLGKLMNFKGSVSSSVKQKGNNLYSVHRVSVKPNKIMSMYTNIRVLSISTFSSLLFQASAMMPLTASQRPVCWLCLSSTIFCPSLPQSDTRYIQLGPQILSDIYLGPLAA